jgi:hypothetical protein
MTDRLRIESPFAEIASRRIGMENLKYPPGSV